MNTICYYLWCCGCCGLCCRQPFKRKHRTADKMNTLSQYKRIKPPTAERNLPSNTTPDAMTEKQMTDIYNIPDAKYKTVDDVLKRHNMSLGAKEIGRGGFGKVYEAINLEIGPKALIACKVIEIPEPKDDKSRRQREKGLQSIKQELYTLQKLKHPHIIQLLDHFMLVESDPKRKSRHKRISLYIFMHFAPKGTLYDLLHKEGPFDEKDSRYWFAQMLSAMVYMHNKRIAHRDLKLQNVLLDVNHDCLISDFGLCKVYAETEERIGIEAFEAKTFCGTTAYMPPEMLDRKRDNKSKYKYNPFMADVWALGVILFQLFTSEQPFPSTNKMRVGKVVRLMHKKAYVWGGRGGHHPTPLLEMIVKLMLDPNVKSRATMKSLTENPWVIDTYKIVEQKCADLMRAQTDKNKSGQTPSGQVSKRVPDNEKLNKRPKEEPKAAVSPKDKNNMRVESTGSGYYQELIKGQQKVRSVSQYKGPNTPNV